MNEPIGFVAGGKTEVQQVTRFRETAQKSYRMSKEGAMETVGQLYLLWRTVVSDVASQKGKEWYKEEVKELNEAIDAHNKEVSRILVKVKSYESGKLIPADVFSTEGKSEEEAYQIKQEEKLFYEYQSLDPRERYYLKQVKLNIFDKEFEYTSLVRFGLELYDALYNDVVSRYAKVLKAVVKNTDITFTTEASQIVEFLKGKGGFEAVLKRAQDESDADQEEMARDQIIENDAANFAREAVLSLGSKVSFEMESRYSKGGYVLMVARAQGGLAEILGEAEMTENEIKKAVLHLGNEAQIPDNDNSEFFYRVVELGRLIREGQSANITRDGTQSGEVYKPEKTMVIRQAEDGHPHVVVSNRYGESSAIIYARPKEWPDFEAIDRDVILPNDNMQRLQKDLSTLAKRRRIEYSFVDKPLGKDGKETKSPISMEVRYQALVDAAEKDPIKQFFWNDLRGQRNKPLDVDHFTPQFVTVLDQVDAVQILNGPYQGWDESKNGAKGKSTTSLIFEDDQLTIRVTKKDDHIVKLAHSVGGSFTLTFNQKDIYDLLTLITKQHADKYQIRGDEGGLMSVSWEDKIGTYTVNLPTITKSGNLETRRVSVMRFAAQPQLAAE
jgi:hypothetical protein